MDSWRKKMKEFLWPVTKLFVLSWLSCFFGFIMVYKARLSDKIVYGSFFCLIVVVLIWRIASNF